MVDVMKGVVEHIQSPAHKGQTVTAVPSSRALVPVREKLIAFATLPRGGHQGHECVAGAGAPSRWNQVVSGVRFRSEIVPVVDVTRRAQLQIAQHHGACQPF